MLVSVIKIIANISITIILIIISFVLFRVMVSRLFNISLLFMYHLAGSICAICNTLSGIYFAGIKAPHRNACDNEMTFTSAVIAFLLYIKLLINSARVRVVKVNIVVFSIYNIPFIFSSGSFKRISPSII